MSDTPRTRTPTSIGDAGNTTKEVDDTNEQEDELQSHTIHNDPNDDIVIISKDEVKFRASSFHLRRVSSFFEGMLTTARPREHQEKLDIERIHLDYPAEVIELYLDLASVSFPILRPLTIEGANMLLQLTDFTISDTLGIHARAALVKVASQQPLELLVIASERDDVDMAQEALSMIHSTDIKQSLFSSSSTIVTDEDRSQFLHFIDRLSPSFRLELLTRLLGQGRGEGSPIRHA